MKTFAIVLFATILIAGCSSSKSVERSESHTTRIEIDTTVTVEMQAIIDSLNAEYQESPDEVTITSTDSSHAKPVLVVRHNRRTNQTVVEYQPPPQKVPVKAKVETTVETVETKTESKGVIDQWGGLIVKVIAAALIVFGIYLFIKFKR